MSNTPRTPGVVEGRLDAATLEQNFADLHPALDGHEAAVAADRCYFCHDAPCVTACPTEIDIPLFIRQISTGQPEAAAMTILSQNVLGGMCARVCPTETLCEEACVREAAEGEPVIIGRLQRFATDSIMEKPHPFVAAPDTGKTIAVVGAGPAGLACAHRLALYGNKVTIFDARSKGGGLNEFGIAAYKTVDGFAQAELDWLLEVGGITVEYDQKLGSDLTLNALQDRFDAVFLGIGLGGVRALSDGSDDLARPAVDFIADLRQAEGLAQVPIGRRIVVIGGGMTAIDAAVQSRLLGADDVTIAYRRGPQNMSASRFEQDLATSKGVRILHFAEPSDMKRKGNSTEVTFALNAPDGSGRTSETLTLEADQVLLAIGQTLEGIGDGLDVRDGKIAVTNDGQTSLKGVWAGGDCTAGGDDLTVTAVAQGRDAAEAIHAWLGAPEH